MIAVVLTTKLILYFRNLLLADYNPLHSLIILPKLPSLNVNKQIPFPFSIFTNFASNPHVI